MLLYKFLSLLRFLIFEVSEVFGCEMTLSDWVICWLEKYDISRRQMSCIIIVNDQ